MQNPDSKKMTEAQRFAYEHLSKALNSSPQFKVGLLMLTHPPLKDGYVCRIASGVIMKQPIDDATCQHLITLIGGLRDMADRLDAMIENPELIGRMLTDESMS